MVGGGGALLLTSAWPPAFRSLLQRSHLRHNLCQSFPSDATFSAAHERQETRHSFTRENGITASHRACVCVCVL